MDENDGTLNPPCLLPERIFAHGEEPTGVRVSLYHKACGIREIFKALEPDEVEEIRLSPFGKLIDIADKSSFSGRFGRYIISRQLRVNKKHEAWFLFAGKPIRFSIREFALVTGLNCKKFPQRSKKKSSKSSIQQKPYWIDLFGSLREITVAAVLRMLQKKTVVDREVRLKYAYLSLLAAVLLPTTHTPRISQESAEMIKDFDAFFAYPWGRVSFNLLMNSLKERKELSLTQNTIALKGFVLSLQLVMIECVPALTEVVQEGSSSGSDADDDALDSDKAGKKSISPGHARDIDAAGKSIMLDVDGEITVDADCEWSDDEDDVRVSNMVNLIQHSFPFTSQHFRGGATKADVSRMREESNAELVNRRSVKSKSAVNTPVQVGVDMELLASTMRDKLKDDFQLLHGNIGTMQESITGFTDTILTNFGELFELVHDSVAKITTLSAEFQNLASTVNVAPVGRAPPRPSVVDAGTQTMPDPSSIISEAIQFANRSTNTTADHLPIGDMANTGVSGVTDKTVQPAVIPASIELTRSVSDPVQSVDPAMLFPNPSFSLGLTQQAHMECGKTSIVAAATEQEDDEEEQVAATSEEDLLGCRKSKRQKVPTKSLLGEYECDRGFLNRARMAVSDAIYKGGDIDYSAKFSALLDKMKGTFVISTERGDILSTELFVVVEKSTQLSPKVMDVLMFHTSNLFRSQHAQNHQPACIFMDTQFISQFTKLYTKFSRVNKKETFKFSANVVAALKQNPNADRFYFPFNMDKKYWVGICVDCTSWSVTVLDCNNSLRTDQMMNKEVRPIALMFPYLLNHVGRDFGMRDGKAMAFERPRAIPQQPVVTFSAVSAVLLIQAHAVGGVDACKFITPDVLDSQVERLVVSLYEATVGPL